MSRRVPHVAAAFLITAVAVLASCTAGRDVDGDPTSSESVTPEAPPTYTGEELPDIELTEVEVPEDLNVGSAYSAWRDEDLVVVSGIDADEGYAVTAAFDLSTGKTLWSTLDEGFEDVEDEDGPVTLFSGGYDEVYLEEPSAILSTTYINPCPQDASICHDSQTDVTNGFGLVALDARDPSTVLWRNDVHPPMDRDATGVEVYDEQYIDVVGASSQAIAVVEGEGTLESSGLDGAVFSTIVLAPADGKTLWEAEQFFPDVLTEEHLLGVEQQVTDSGVLQSRDPLTGEVLWSLDGVTGRWISAEGNLGLAGVMDPETGAATKALLVDLSTGEILDDEVGSAGPEGTVPVLASDVVLGTQDGMPYAAWVSNRDVEDPEDPRWFLSSQDADSTDAVDGAVPFRDHSFVDPAGDGYVWARTVGEGSDYTFAAYDRTGAPRSEVLSTSFVRTYDGLLVADGGDTVDPQENVRIWTYEFPAG